MLLRHLLQPLDAQLSEGFREQLHDRWLVVRLQGDPAAPQPLHVVDDAVNRESLLVDPLTRYDMRKERLALVVPYNKDLRGSFASSLKLLLTPYLGTVTQEGVVE